MAANMFANTAADMAINMAANLEVNMQREINLFIFCHIFTSTNMVTTSNELRLQTV